ncbi:MAG TPA: D-glycero-beta-D-manno-heptose-7-phosphate kinase [Ignavibacteriaceae bacterium]|nr:D-glycero-beta-D-manno-heptose-7-phosphate kinase [Ignavibacteriaceae bacterium]
MKISLSRLNSLKSNFVNKRIAVIGDMMLDCYFWGEVKRISPEAPVPVVEVDNEFYRFGGAANVAYNILKLGGVPIPIGVIGYDNAGSIFTSLLNDSNIFSDGLITDDKRPTTAKTRVIAQNQHVVRIDKEKKNEISSETENKIFEFFLAQLDSLDGIIFQDYNKGVLTSSLIEKIISAAKTKNLLITVDPKFTNFFNYKDVTVFKPNRKEAGDVLGLQIKSREDVNFAGNQLLDKLNAKYILLTLSEEGIAVFQKGFEEKRIPTKARKVADVSGAGDTVISTLTMALSAGADIYEASYLANYAGGIVCEEVGIVPIELNTLFDMVEKEAVE